VPSLLDVKTTELDTSGEQVSALALGAMGMGTRADDATSFATLDAYADDGGGFIDTADGYAWFYAPGTDGGQSEELLGRWLRRTRRRDAVFLATKGAGMVTNPRDLYPAGAQAPDWRKAVFVGAGADTLRTALEGKGSLRRLGVEHIDLYYVHVDDPSTPLEETLGALAAFVAEGKIRHIGWSNVSSERLEEIRAVAQRNGFPQPVAVQQQHSYLDPVAGRGFPAVDEAQLGYLRSRSDLTLIAYSPLLKGLYDEPAGRRAQLVAESRDAVDPAMKQLAVLDAVAAETRASPGQVVLAWLAARRSPSTIPLIGTTRVDRYRHAAAALDLELSPSQLALLDARSS
jgi:aryl-alcohol dehydrogenase-like predicted oxidoreductase